VAYQVAFAPDVLDADQEDPDAVNQDLGVDPDEAPEGHSVADASPGVPDEAPGDLGESWEVRDESLEGLDATPVALGGDLGLDAGLGVPGEGLEALDEGPEALDEGPDADLGVLDVVLDSGESRAEVDGVREGPGGGLLGLGVGQVLDEDRAGLDESLKQRTGKHLMLLIT
jgi:hypothetical protein